MLRPRYLIFALLLLVGGCCSPSADNIRLRKINQDLNSHIALLTTQKQSAERMIAGLIARSPAIPVLPQSALDKLWVTAGITFGRLTGEVQEDYPKPAKIIMVYITPVDQNAQSIQAAGSFVVEAFDLAESKNNRLAHWSWDTVNAKSQWRSFLLEFGYELRCPWEIIPRHPDITLRVTFTDELTHIPYIAEKMIHVDIPPPPIPASAPTTAAIR